MNIILIRTAVNKYVYISLNSQGTDKNIVTKVEVFFKKLRNYRGSTYDTRLKNRLICVTFFESQKVEVAMQS